MGNNYSIRFKTNGVGYSGGVTISISKGNFFKLDFNEKIDDSIIVKNLSQVKTAIQHGINLFFYSHEYFKMDEYTIVIEDIEYNSIDSSLTIMTFVTYNSLVNCFNLSEGEQLKVDKEKGRFMFPR